MTAIENRMPDFNPTSINKQFTAALVRDKEGNITGLNQAVLNSLDPQLAAYMRAAMEVITAKLRKESGAAISASEWSSELVKVLPSSSKEFRAAQENRKRQIKALAAASGAPDLDTLYEAAGFGDTSYNADEWYKDLFGEPSVTSTGSDGSTEVKSVKDLLGGRN